MTPLSPGRQPQVSLAMDIGGSHAVAGVVDLDRGCVVDGSRTRVAVDTAAETDTILGAWFGAARRALESAGGPAIVGAGIAMPGPFDYEQGICLVRGLAKLESLYGVNVRAEMKARVPAVAAAPVIFRNDAVCFLLGEAGFGAARGMGDAIGITLGTGLGSAFVRDGAVVEGGDDLPPGGWLYDQPFRGATAEEYFSSRGLLARHRDAGGASVPGVRELAQLASTEPQAAAALEDFGASLAEFLDPWIARFRPRCLVVGGNVARAWDRFAPPLCGALGRRWPDLAVRQSALFEDAALLGAARLPLLCREPQPS